MIKDVGVCLQSCHNCGKVVEYMTNYHTLFISKWHIKRP